MGVKQIALTCLMGFAFAKVGLHTLDVQTEYYKDANDSWSASPSFQWWKPFNEFWEFGIQQELDATTGATRSWFRQSSHSEIDGVSGATVEPVNGKIATTPQSHVPTVPEIRYGGTYNVGYDNEGRGGYITFSHSQENDYFSLAPGFTLNWDFAERNTSVSIGYHHYFDEFTPLPQFGKGGKKQIQSYNASLSQTLTPTTLIHLATTFSHQAGYLHKPYYPVLTPQGYIEENTPNLKNTFSNSIKLVQGFRLLPDLGSLRASYNYYFDSWGLKAHTLESQISQYFGEELYLRLRYRYYIQSGVSFYQENYNHNDLYRTVDVKIAPYQTHLIGIKLGSYLPDFFQETTWLPDQINMKADYTIRVLGINSSTENLRKHYQLYTDFYDQWTLYAGLHYEF